LRRRLLFATHGGRWGAHCGGHKLMKFLQRQWYWPDMQSQVHDYCTRCPLCQFLRGGKGCLHGVGSLPTDTFMGIVSLDFLEKRPWQGTTWYILVFVEHYSRLMLT